MSKKKRKVEATTTESHKVRSTVILLVVGIASFGVWYLLNERD
jgi:hypothetical protein